MTGNAAARLLAYGVLAAGYSFAMRAQEPSGVRAAAGDDVESLQSMAQQKSADTPATVPQISCQGNQLTIAADNSTMSSVLAGIRTCIGFEIQIPNDLADERTFIKLGPGPVREVLDDLLSSTDFNFVIQSSSSIPGKISNVILTSRTKDNLDSQDGRGPSLPATLNMTPARRAWFASRNGGRPAAPPTDGPQGMPVNGEHEATIPDGAVAPAPSESKAAVPSTSASPTGEGFQQVEGAAILPLLSAPETAAVLDTVPAPAPAGPGDGVAEGNVLQKQINQMQQLFEQRKSMNSSPNAPQNPN